MSNKALWAQAAELMGEQELARRFRVWINNLIKKELARRSNMSVSELFLQQAGEILADLNELTGRRYTLTDETKSMIRGRMSAGASVDDFKKVHRVMCARWLEDPKMRDYLRPSTLYRAGHFDEYLALSFEKGKTEGQRDRGPTPEWRAQEAAADAKLAEKLLKRAWWAFDTWDEFMRWTLQFPDADSLGRYEMPERIRKMRHAPQMLMKVLTGPVDWAEAEYEQIKADRGENG
jgi:uncharacterized phage protein (TIGR02220 family)